MNQGLLFWAIVILVLATVTSLVIQRIEVIAAGIYIDVFIAFILNKTSVNE